MHIIENAPAWVDKLAWNSCNNQLAFSLGRYVQVWDADTNEVIATLNFDNSSVLGLDRSPDEQKLAIAGYQGAKIWNAQNWNDDPYVLVVPSASLVLAQAWACPTSPFNPIASYWLQHWKMVRFVYGKKPRN